MDVIWGEEISRLYNEYLAMPRGEKTCKDCPARCLYFAEDQDWVDCAYPGGPVIRGGAIGFAVGYANAREEGMRAKG